MKVLFLITGIILLSFVNISQEPLYIQTIPCPNCTAEFLETLYLANESLYCALYDISHPKVIELFDEKSKTSIVEVMTEKKNADFYRDYLFTDSNYALMHNKFCVIDERVIITGSANPTINGFEYNDNIMFVYDNTDIARTFLQEFEELKTKDEQIQQQQFQRLNIYFCPENNCRDKLISEIRRAKQSIYFATFAFTDQAIATELILAEKKGVDIKGVIEKRMFSTSVASRLLQQNISVVVDTNPKTMHHKMFIVDEKVAITGSYNPTKNGNLRNDETMMIVRDEEIVKNVLQEIKKLLIT